MILQAWLTLPSCLANSSSPTLVRMIFWSRVIVGSSLARFKNSLGADNQGNPLHVRSDLSFYILSDGLASVKAACAEALDQGVHSAGVVLNILARKQDPAPAVSILSPEALRLRHAPARAAAHCR